MYRKGLSSRANKISSLVASIDNSGPGSIGQDSVPTAGTHGIRKNVFRRMPALIPNKSQSRFSKMNIYTRPYPFHTRQGLLDAIDEYFFTNKDKAWRQYGDIGTWDVSRITDMTYLFSKDGDGGSVAKAALTENELGGISNWNVSNVTNMEAMFRGSQFNGDLSKWDVSNCTKFVQMFQSGCAFNNDSILYWDVRGAGSFNGMFAGGQTAFDVQTINYWNITVSVDAVTSMFAGNTNFPDGPGITSGLPDATFFNKITFLTGDEAITLERGNTFVDPGATTVTGEIPVLVTSFDVNTIGTYTITYNVTNPRGASGTINRTVTVVDTILPVVTINGSSYNLQQGATYTDGGATTTEGTIVRSIIGPNGDIAEVDTSILGTYTITYTATDAANNQGTATRTVTVVDTIPPTITSGVTGINLVDNSAAGQTIYTIEATNAVGVTSYAIGGTDAASLIVNSSTGVVTLTDSPVYATKSSYSFDVTASDEHGNTSATTTVTFSITEVE